MYEIKQLQEFEKYGPLYINKFGKTLLMKYLLFCEIPCPLIVQQILANGQDINLQDEDGITAIIDASFNPNTPPGVY